MVKEILATADEVIELTYAKSDSLERYLCYREFQQNPDISYKDISGKYNIKQATFDSWRSRGAVPHYIPFIDWALENNFLEPVDGSFAKTGLGITPGTLRYPLLEKLTYLVWATGTLIIGRGCNVAVHGAKDSLDELCEDINSQLGTEFEPKKQKEYESYSVYFAPAHLGRLIAPLIGYKNKKIDNMTDVPPIAKRGLASKRRFLQTLNGAKGVIFTDKRTKSNLQRYQISLAAQRKEADAKKLAENVLELIKDVTDIELGHCITAKTKHNKTNHTPLLYTSLSQVAEYLEACNFNI